MNKMDGDFSQKLTKETKRESGDCFSGIPIKRKAGALETYASESGMPYERKKTVDTIFCLLCPILSPYVPVCPPPRPIFFNSTLQIVV